MPPFCLLCRREYGHDIFCPNHPHKGKEFLSYPEGVGDVRFHRFDGQTVTLKRVQYDTVGTIANAQPDDTSGDFENGNTFHVPNVAWWEVVYE